MMLGVCHISLHDAEAEEKVILLCHHSEKVADTFGFIGTPPATPLQIFKNLQVCGDCHSDTKSGAKIVRQLLQ